MKFLRVSLMCVLCLMTTQAFAEWVVVNPPTVIYQKKYVVPTTDVWMAPVLVAQRNRPHKAAKHAAKAAKHKTLAEFYGAE